jgi:ABC-type transport system involved in multi-copper enzyme maturation permease subunit
MNLAVVAETVRRNLLSPGFIVFMAFVCVIAVGTTYLTGSPGSWQTFLGLIVIVTGAQLIGPEFSSGTLQLILVRPINRSVYVVSRWTGAALTILVAILIALAADAITMMSLGTVPWRPMLASATNRFADALLVCALLAFFGSFLRSYFNVAVLFMLQIGLGFLLDAIEEMRPGMTGMIGWLVTFFNSHPAVGKAIAAVARNLYPARPSDFNMDYYLLILSNTAVALLLTCLIFRRREVPYGAD